MQSIIDIFKWSLHPSSALTIMLLFTIGSVLLYIGKGKWGRRWITIVAVAYWIMATPACASLIEWPLTRGQSRIRTADEAEGAGVIVVLSGGTFTFRSGSQAITSLVEDSAVRAIEAARVYRLLGAPTVITSGGRTSRIQVESEAEALADVLVTLGVPRDRILLEKDSKTTYEEAVLIRPLLLSRHVERFVLVTSAAHMRRSMAAFQRQGLHPIPSPPIEDDEVGPPQSSLLSRFIPSKSGLLTSDGAVYEYTGLLYYWTKGRLK